MDISFAARLPHEELVTVKSLTQARVDQLLDSTQAILEKSKSSRLSTKAAAEMTLKLEQEFLAVHITAAIEFETKSMRQMFHSIGKSEEEHCREIRAYCVAASIKA